MLQELQLPFIKLAATEVVSGVSGESEEKLRDIFNSATVSYQMSGINLIKLGLYKIYNIYNYIYI